MLVDILGQLYLRLFQMFVPSEHNLRHTPKLTASDELQANSNITGFISCGYFVIESIKKLRLQPWRYIN